jgi:3-phenylpropionate/trans-cinnamate dioxygenase ferredoxin reductase subunit
VEGERFSVFCFDEGGVLIGVESINRPSDHMVARRLIQSGVPVTREQILDPGLDLRALALGKVRKASTAPR